jgi:hypothetical protein
MKPSHGSDIEHIFLLLDSEENFPTDVIGEEGLSSGKENEGFTASDLLKNHSVQKMPFEDRHVSLKQQTRSESSASSRKSTLREAEIVVTTLSWCGGDIYAVCSQTASAIKHGNFSKQDLFDVVIDEAAQVGSQTLNTNCSL